MRTWKLTASDPLCLTLAADCRFSAVDYANDQIWEVNWQSGAPPALAVETTFGLRARNFRIFPRFSEGDRTYTDPAEFAGKPTIQQAFPNYLFLHCTPIPEIDVNYEIWVPSSQTLAGRLTLMNQSSGDRSILLDLAAQLTPNEGQRMASLELEAASVLSGLTADLSPIVFMTGGSKPGGGSFPSLRQALEFKPGESKSVLWTQAALSSPISSFAAARLLATRNWDAEISRIELLNSGNLEIYTGNADWDATFKWAQKQAQSLIVGPGPGLPYPSIVLSRQPDQGYSIRGDGSDYTHLWNGQSPLDVLLLSDLLLPGGADTVKGLIRNFIAIQQDDGFIDFKPGLAQQRSRKLATPLLATITLRIFETTGDRGFIEEVYPALLKFVRQWFTPEHDRDQDGVPEWDHAIQSGFEDHPLYASWNNGPQEIEISSAESPSLIAFLLNELDSLNRIAVELTRNGIADEFETHAAHLKTVLPEFWDDKHALFMERDRDTHTSQPTQLLGGRQGPGAIHLNCKFLQPARLLIKIQSSNAITRRPRLTVYGTTHTGEKQVDVIPDERFKWLHGRGSLTGEQIYQSIEWIEVENCNDEDQIAVFSAGYQCATLPQLLPLWTGQVGEAIALKLVTGTVTNPERFWQTYGLPNCLDVPRTPENELSTSCDPMWNGLIADGLLRSGYPQQAAELFTRLMNSSVQSLKLERGFRRYYQPETGNGMGELNSLNGLPPVGLFLRILGVQIHSATEVEIHGENPFSWPITIKYQGLTILRGKEKTTVIFPDGQTVELNEPTPCVVSLEMP